MPALGGGSRPGLSCLVSWHLSPVDLEQPCFSLSFLLQKATLAVMFPPHPSLHKPPTSRDKPSLSPAPSLQADGVTGRQTMLHVPLEGGKTRKNMQQHPFLPFSDNFFHQALVPGINCMDTLLLLFLTTNTPCSSLELLRRKNLPLGNR